MFVRSLLLAVTVIACGPAVAAAVSVQDIVALSKAGLADEVLTAVIDADGTVFTLSREQIIELRDAGVSARVLIKMIGSAREFESRSADAAASADRAVADHPVIVVGSSPSPAPILALSPATIVVPYYVPVLVPSARGGVRPQTPSPMNSGAAPVGFGRFMNDGWVEPSRPGDSGSFGRFMNDGWVDPNVAARTHRTKK